jgi:hypothetical protein
LESCATETSPLIWALILDIARIRANGPALIICELRSDFEPAINPDSATNKTSKLSRMKAPATF